MRRRFPTRYIDGREVWGALVDAAVAVALGVVFGVVFVGGALWLLGGCG